ncbi:MAG: prealbumin-like fold domain-containing protein, partial [Anaerovoracaceae bacterium]
TADPVTFRIDDEGVLYIIDASGNETKADEAVVTMKDTKKPETPPYNPPDNPPEPETPKYEVSFSKVDMTTAEALSGASFELVSGKDENGTSVETWISDGTDHKVSDLVPGYYTIIERVAPEGYKTADPVTFRLDGSGSVHIVYSDGSESEAMDPKVTVEDEKKPVPVDDKPDYNEEKPENPDTPTKTDRKTSYSSLYAPRTGDTSETFIWVSLVILAGAASCILLRLRRSKR